MRDQQKPLITDTLRHDYDYFDIPIEVRRSRLRHYRAQMGMDGDKSIVDELNIYELNKQLKHYENIFFTRYSV